MSDYDEIKKKIKREIQDCHMLKEAQVPDSAHAFRYQSGVTGLTNLLHEYEQNLPRLREIDREIRVAQSDLEAALRAAEAGAPFPKAAAWTGGLGTVGLLASLGLGLPGSVTTVSILLGLVSGLCVVMAVRRRRDDHDESHRARAYLSELIDERDELMPQDFDAVIEMAATGRAASGARVQIVNGPDGGVA